MKCHYEVLGVSRDIDDDGLKKTYRKLALKWHPDKNPDNVDECRQTFVLIQQAYETLSDPHERAFYDKHRESILKGGFDEHYTDESINLFSYFSSSCYSGFGSDTKSFFSVYSHVFETLSLEDYDFVDDPSVRYPEFGNAESDYASVVGPFYGFWTAFSTARSFVWVEEYDLRQAPNRPTMRAMEKENKRLREEAKKERNAQIRELATFMRKRDPRVKKYKEFLEEKRKETEKKNEENRRNQMRKRIEEREAVAFAESEEAKQARLAHLAELEEQWGGGESAESGEELDDETPFCIVCNKIFKTMNAKVNHEKSKNHKKVLAELKKHMKEEDAELFQGSDNRDSNSDEKVLEIASLPSPIGKKSKKAKKRAKQLKKSMYEQNEEEEDDDEVTKNDVDELDEEPPQKPEKISKKEKRKAKKLIMSDSENEEQGNIQERNSDDEVIDKLKCLTVDELNVSDNDRDADVDDLPPDSNANPFEMASKAADEEIKKKKNDKKKKEKSNVSAENCDFEGSKTARCDRCKEFFESRSKLFAHLKETGHATLLPTNDAKVKGKKGKKK